MKISDSEKLLFFVVIPFWIILVSICFYHIGHRYNKEEISTCKVEKIEMTSKYPQIYVFNEKYNLSGYDYIGGTVVYPKMLNLETCKCKILFENDTPKKLEFIGFNSND